MTRRVERSSDMVNLVIGLMETDLHQMSASVGMSLLSSHFSLVITHRRSSHQPRTLSNRLPPGEEGTARAAKFKEGVLVAR